ncbi:MAG: diaminopimelate decarboxylase [Planctomycetes bacterium]|nr:diaminopimelate decarboxylase [Planctomycetota bacterium]
MVFKIQNLETVNGNFEFDGANINKLVKEFQTPLYVYSTSTINKRINELNETFSTITENYQLYYAVKANSNLSVLKTIADAGLGFDVVSAGELTRVLKVTNRADNVVFAGVGKTESEIKFAINSGIHSFNVESVPELEHIDKICHELAKPANITLRINPNVDAHTHAYITTGTEKNKFGISIEQVDSALNVIISSKYLNFIGFHMHLGSQIELGMPYRLGLDVLKTLISKASERNLETKEIDIGGGFSVGYLENRDFDLQDFIKQIKPQIPKNIRISAEPGRYIVAESGILLTKVLYRKGRFAIVDASMTDCIRPTLYDAYHPIANLTKNIFPKTDEFSKINAGVFDNKPSIDIVGPVCETGDFLGLKRPMLADSGDILAVLYAGAYGISMSSNYNSRPKSAEVLVNKGKVQLIGKRETFEDLFRNEIL